MRAKQSNEGKCCDAVLRILEDRFAASRASITRDDGARRAGIDIYCDIGGRKIAMEHTRVEPYEHKVADDQRLERFMKPVLARLEQLLQISPTGAVQILFDVLVLQGIKERTWPSIQEAMVEWVAAVAPTLAEPKAERFTAYRGRPDGVPFEICLHRVVRLTSKVSYMRFSPQDLEGKRTGRVRKAVSDKLPKLQAYRRDGAFTVLVIEDDDIALSNEALIAAAVENALNDVAASKNDAVLPPDAIFLVDTSTQAMWIVVCLRQGKETWPTTDPIGSNYARFDPTQLADITTDT